MEPKDGIEPATYASVDRRGMKTRRDDFHAGVAYETPPRDRR